MTLWLERTSTPTMQYTCVLATGKSETAGIVLHTSWGKLSLCRGIDQARQKNATESHVHGVSQSVRSKKLFLMVTISYLLVGRALLCCIWKIIVTTYYIYAGRKYKSILEAENLTNSARGDMQLLIGRKKCKSKP